MTTQGTKTTVCIADWKSCISSARGTLQAAHNTAVLATKVAPQARARAFKALEGAFRSELAMLEADFRCFKTSSTRNATSKGEGVGNRSKADGHGNSAGDVDMGVTSTSARRRPRRRRKARSAPAPTHPSLALQLVGVSDSTPELADDSWADEAPRRTASASGRTLRERRSGSRSPRLSAGVKSGTGAVVAAVGLATTVSSSTTSPEHLAAIRRGTTLRPAAAVNAAFGGIPEVADDFSFDVFASEAGNKSGGG